jgi:hypothetical protein
MVNPSPEPPNLRVVEESASRKRKETTETMAEERKFPNRDCQTTTIRYKKLMVKNPT